jgi:ribosomal protein S18 acetylase RimI-like enzyme
MWKTDEDFMKARGHPMRATHHPNGMEVVMGATVALTSPSRAEPAIAVIVLAFGADPAARWTYPDADRYLTHFPEIVRAFGGRAFAHGTAYHVGDVLGAALWLPPGVGPDEEALGEILRRSVPEERLATVLAVFEKMGTYHPAEPHWYLPLLGVDPAHQRAGHGGALLDHVLRQCDRDHAPAYLESSNPANISLYERHGFRRLATIQVGSSPPVVPMLRSAR